MPGHTDVAAVFFEPGQLDPLGGVPEEFFGQSWQRAANFAGVKSSSEECGR